MGIFEKKFEDYKGYVWCVRTKKTGNILAGKTKFIFTGNCPYPDKSDLRIKHLFEVLPEELAHAVYKDMARRDLIQQIGRGLRHENDWIILAVFDKIALEVLKKENLWEIEEVSGIEEVIGRNLGNNRIG